MTEARSFGDLLREIEQSEFVDRVTELTIFRDLLTKDAPHRVLAIDGVAGVGKSHLLRHFAELCEELGAIVFFFDFESVQNLIDFAAAFCKQLEVAPRNRRSFRRLRKEIGKVRTALGRVYPEGKVAFVTKAALSGLKSLIPFGAPVLDGIDSDERVEKMIGDFLQQKADLTDVDLLANSEERFARLITELMADLTRESRRCVVMLDTYEKAGRFDTFLREKFLAKLPREAIVVISGRNSLGPKWQPFEPLIKRVSLVNFAEADTRAYLRNKGVTEDGFVREVFEFTQGHPLSVALSADAHGRGSTAGEAEIEASDRLVVVRALVDRVLQGVTRADLKRLLEACAVVRVFNESVLKSIGPSLPVAECFQDVIDFSFVKGARDGFSLHELVRAFLLEELRVRAPERYSELNTRALEHFSTAADEAAGIGKQRFLLEVLHHEVALNEARGVETFCELFERAARVFDRPFCEELARQFTGYQFSLPAAQQWLRYYESALAFRRGEWSEQEELCKELLAEPELPSELARRAGVDLANAYMRHGKTRQAESLLLERLDSLDLEPGPLFADMLLELGKVHRWRNDWGQALERFGEAYSLYRAVENTSRMAEAEMHMGAVNQLRGRFGEARDLLHGSLEHFAEGSNEYGFSRALFNLAWVCTYLGRYQEAGEYCRRSMRLAEALGARHSVASIGVLSARLSRLAGRYDDARKLLEQSGRIIESLGYDVYLGLWHQECGLTWDRLGDGELALRHLRSSVDAFNSVGAHAEEALSLALLGQILHVSRRYRDGAEACAEALRLLETEEQAYAEALAHYALYVSSRAQAPKDTPIAALERAHRISKELGFTELQALVEMEWASVALDSGDLAAGSELASSACCAAALHHESTLADTMGRVYDLLEALSPEPRSDVIDEFVDRISRHVEARELRPPHDERVLTALAATASLARGGRPFAAGELWSMDS